MIASGTVPEPKITYIYLAVRVRQVLKREVRLRRAANRLQILLLLAGKPVGGMNCPGQRGPHHNRRLLPPGASAKSFHLEKYIK